MFIILNSWFLVTLRKQRKSLHLISLRKEGLKTHQPSKKRKKARTWFCKLDIFSFLIFVFSCVQRILLNLWQLTINEPNKIWFLHFVVKSSDFVNLQDYDILCWNYKILILTCMFLVCICYWISTSVPHNLLGKLEGTKKKNENEGRAISIFKRNYKM